MKRRPPPFTKAVLHQAIINFCQTDLYLLVLSFLATFLLLLSTGFNPATMLLGSYDISGQHLAFYRFPYHHFPQEYWIDILGGTLGHSVYGMPFMYWLYTFGLLSLKNYFFIFHLTIMAALPYLCFKILAILLPPASLYAFPSKSSSGIFSPLVTFIIIFNFAALPAMGSKIIAGHSNIILGTVFFFLVLSWILAVWEKQYSLTHMLFSLLLLLQIFPYYNYHMLHTAICYGWPLGIILLGLYVRKKHRKEEAGSINSEGESKNRNKSIIAQKITKLKWILVKFWQDYRVSLLLFIGAFGVCFYQFYGMVTAFTGPDLARHLSGTPATFTYQTLYHSWYDWLNSLFVSKWWAKLYLPEIFINPSFHETNYPLGPLFFLTIGMLFIKTKSRKTILRPAYAAALFFLWWGIMMLFCLNLHPLSDLMLKIIPFAGSFRIPNRIFLLACMAYKF